MNWKTRILLYGGFFLGVFSGGRTSASVQEQDDRRVIDVHLSAHPSERTDELELLKTYDFMGMDTELNAAQFYVTASELNEIRALGFQFDSHHIDFARIDLSQYLSPDLLQSKLEQLQQAYPSLMYFRSIGTTHKGRPIWGIQLSSSVLGQDDKPAILLNAMHHAREVMTTEVVYHAIEKLLRDYTAGDSETMHWLDSYRVLFVPQVNPDGNDFVHSSDRMWRKNAWESDGRLYGVDVNRNYPAYWDACRGSSGNKGAQDYRGPSPASEPEVETMIDLVAAERPVFNISYHAYSQMILYPFGCTNEKNTAVDLFKNVASEMNKATLDDRGRANRYDVGTPPELLYAVDGGDIDWQWKEYGVISFAMEVNSSSLGFWPNYNNWRDITVERLEGSWKALLRRMDQGAVRAKIEGLSPEEVDQVSYHIERPGRANWTDADVKPFPLRSRGGLFYQILQPGEYTIVFYKNGKVAKYIPVKVTNGLVDLGNLNL